MIGINVVSYIIRINHCEVVRKWHRIAPQIVPLPFLFFSLIHSRCAVLSCLFVSSLFIFCIIIIVMFSAGFFIVVSSFVRNFYIFIFIIWFLFHVSSYLFNSFFYIIELSTDCLWFCLFCVTKFNWIWFVFQWDNPILCYFKLNYYFYWF